LPGGPTEVPCSPSALVCYLGSETKLCRYRRVVVRICELTRHGGSFRIVDHSLYNDCRSYFTPINGSVGYGPGPTVLACLRKPKRREVCYLQQPIETHTANGGGGGVLPPASSHLSVMISQKSSYQISSRLFRNGTTSIISDFRCRSKKRWPL
jgi:hypothetical protein